MGNRPRRAARQADARLLRWCSASGGDPPPRRRGSGRLWPASRLAGRQGPHRRPRRANRAVVATSGGRRRDAGGRRRAERRLFVLTLGYSRKTPTLNPLYRDVLAHYGVVALPCPVRDLDRSSAWRRSPGCRRGPPGGGSGRRCSWTVLAFAIGVLRRGFGERFRADFRPLQKFWSPSSIRLCSGNGSASRNCTRAGASGDRQYSDTL